MRRGRVGMKVKKEERNDCSLQKACYSVGSGRGLAGTQSPNPWWFLSSALHGPPQSHSGSAGKLSKNGVPAKQTWLQHKYLGRIAATQLFLQKVGGLRCSRGSQEASVAYRGHVVELALGVWTLLGR